MKIYDSSFMPSAKDLEAMPNSSALPSLSGNHDRDSDGIPACADRLIKCLFLTEL